MTPTPTANITIPVDLTNPGQFFACCGLLELASRIDENAEGCFGENEFYLAAECSLQSILTIIQQSIITNTMSSVQRARIEELGAMSKKQREATPGLEDEKKTLESLRRELPIVFNGSVPLCIDWFCDDFAGGSRFKTWAGQQSVLDIAQAMQQGLHAAAIDCADALWNSIRNVGLPFNFDSELGGQGSALDIGFSFDPLAGSEITRIKGTCKPALELLCFIGLQRFRPSEVKGKNRYIYAAWNTPVPASIASALGCAKITPSPCPVFEFPLLYRTKYLKSFLPAQPYQGDRDE